MIDEYSTPKEGTQPLSFPAQYATNIMGQYKWLTWRCASAALQSPKAYAGMPTGCLVLQIPGHQLANHRVQRREVRAAACAALQLLLLLEACKACKPRFAVLLPACRPL